MISDFFAGVAVGVSTLIAAQLLAALLRPAQSLEALLRPHGYQPLLSTQLPPPMPKVKLAKRTCRVCYRGDPPCVCCRDATFWDVTCAGSASEPGRIEYRFLGVTGEEES